MHELTWRPTDAGHVLMAGDRLVAWWASDGDWARAARGDRRYVVARVGRAHPRIVIRPEGFLGEVAALDFYTMGEGRFSVGSGAGWALSRGGPSGSDCILHGRNGRCALEIGLRAGEAAPLARVWASPGLAEEPRDLAAILLLHLLMDEHAVGKHPLLAFNGEEARRPTPPGWLESA